jgi:hypothetical protein
MTTLMEGFDETKVSYAVLRNSSITCIEISLLFSEIKLYYGM